MRIFLAVAPIVVLLFGLLSFSQQSPISQSPAAPLSAADVEHGLKAGVSNTRMAALVKQYGVDFELNDAIEKELRAAGANDQLLLGLSRGSSRSSTISAFLLARKEKFSYALGMDVGNNLKAQFVEVDPNLVLQGLQDTMSGSKTRLTPDEAKGLTDVFEKQLRESSGASRSSTTQRPLLARKEKFSYALGMRVGNNLKEHFVEVDLNLVSQGLQDTMSGSKTRLTPDEAKAVFYEVLSPAF